MSKRTSITWLAVGAVVASLAVVVALPPAAAPAAFLFGLALGALLTLHADDTP